MSDEVGKEGKENDIEQPKNSLPWIEKYRPINFESITGHGDKIATIKNFIVRNELPHLLLYGPPGTGKTSLILAMAREMYGENYKKYILELNASDDRGINIVREKIPNFVKIKSDKIRLVILDEADAMTGDAQNALKRVMEIYIKTSRFCLICNNINKINIGVKSRCVMMRFGRVDNVIDKVQYIVEKEGVKIGENEIRELINIEKDLRQILNVLQSLHNDGREITMDVIYEYLGKPTNAEIKELYELMFSDCPFNVVYGKLLDLFKDNKWNVIDLINGLYNEILNRDLSDEAKFNIIGDVSKIEYRIITGRDSEIQLGALLSSIKKFK
jgi:replication factor C subunit 3/5